MMDFAFEILEGYEWVFLAFGIKTKEQIRLNKYKFIVDWII